jgi:hypothetical protein
MIAIDRPTIDADIIMVSIPFVLLSDPIVAVLTERLKLASKEQCLVSLVRSQMVYNLSCNSQSVGFTLFTKRISL